MRHHGIILTIHGPGITETVYGQDWVEVEITGSPLPFG
jgi:hypothetical protein